MMRGSRERLRLAVDPELELLSGFVQARVSELAGEVEDEAVVDRDACEEHRPSVHVFASSDAELPSTSRRTPATPNHVHDQGQDRNDDAGV